MPTFVMIAVQGLAFYYVSMIMMLVSIFQINEYNLKFIKALKNKSLNMSTKFPLSCSRNASALRAALYPDTQKQQWRYFAADNIKMMRTTATERVFRSQPSSSSALDGYIELSKAAMQMSDEDVS